MKKTLLASVFCLALTIPYHRASAQLQEAEQLALDIEKLAQFKSILSEMYKGYQILTSGYNAVKSLAEGNFNLHNAFLNGLLTVSPTVKQYVRVADIISAQLEMVSEYKSALSSFQKAASFSPTELNYISGVFGNLVDRSIDNLTELAMVLTDGQLRMNDAERLSSIDKIYQDMQDKVDFLRDFNGRASTLSSQRQQQSQELSNLQSLYGN